MKKNKLVAALILAIAALIATVLDNGVAPGSCYDQLADNDRVAHIATATGQLPGHVRQHGLHNEKLPFGSKFAVTENPCVQKI